MSRCSIPSAEKCSAGYSSEFKRTTRPMLRILKCTRTFLKGIGRSDWRTSSIVRAGGRSLVEGDCELCRFEEDCCDVGYWGDANARKLGVTQLKSPMSTRSNVSYLLLQQGQVST